MLQPVEKIGAVSPLHFRLDGPHFIGDLPVLFTHVDDSEPHGNFLCQAEDYIMQYYTVR